MEPRIVKKSWCTSKIQPFSLPYNSYNEFGFSRRTAPSDSFVKPPAAILLDQPVDSIKVDYQVKDYTKQEWPMPEATVAAGKDPRADRLVSIGLDAFSEVY
jgi:hypothetical protein